MTDSLIHGAAAVLALAAVFAAYIVRGTVPTELMDLAATIVGGYLGLALPARQVTSTVGVAPVATPTLPAGETAAHAAGAGQ